MTDTADKRIAELRPEHWEDSRQYRAAHPGDTGLYIRKLEDAIRRLYAERDRMVKAVEDVVEGHAKRNPGARANGYSYDWHWRGAMDCLEAMRRASE